VRGQAVLRLLAGTKTATFPGSSETPQHALLLGRRERVLQGRASPPGTRRQIRLGVERAFVRLGDRRIGRAQGFRGKDRAGVFGASDWSSSRDFWDSRPGEGR